MDTEPLSLPLDFQAQSEKKILSSLQRLSALGLRDCTDLKRLDCALDQMKNQKPELKEYTRSLGQMLEVLERRSELVKKMQKTRSQCEDLEKLREEALQQGENLGKKERPKEWRGDIDWEIDVGRRALKELRERVGVKYKSDVITIQSGETCIIYTLDPVKI